MATSNGNNNYFPRKEFQVLLDSIKEKLGDGVLYMAFTLDNKNICVSSEDLKEEISLDETLKYFTG
jgi:hypothetical protein